MAVNPDSTTRKIFSLPNAIAQAVEDYRFENRCKTESEAIRQLVEKGLRLDLVEARALSLENQIIEMAERAGIAGAELDEIRAKLAISRRLVEPFGRDPE